MVLNDPVEAYASDESYSPPSSSPDLYSSPVASSGQTITSSPYKIDPALISSPMPILGPLLGYGKARFQADLQQRLATMSVAHKRRLNNDEVNALVYYSSKASAIASWGTPTGCVVGLYRANATREEYRHPFTGPMKTANGWFDGERIQIMGREILRGIPARNFVHGVRTFNYVLLGAGFFGYMATFYALAVQVAGESRDPRLKEFFQETKDIMQRAITAGDKKGIESITRGRIEPQRIWDELPPTSPWVGGRDPRQRARTKEATTTNPPPAPFTDDASPTSTDNFDNDSIYATYNKPDTEDPYSGFSPDANPQPQTQTQTSSQKPSRYIPKPPSRSSPPRPSYASAPAPAPSAEMDDDATSPSPPPRSGNDDQTSTFDDAAAPDMTAWERIRRGAGSADPDSPPTWPTEEKWSGEEAGDGEQEW